MKRVSDFFEYNRWASVALATVMLAWTLFFTGWMLVYRTNHWATQVAFWIAIIGIVFHGVLYWAPRKYRVLKREPSWFERESEATPFAFLISLAGTLAVMGLFGWWKGDVWSMLIVIEIPTLVTLVVTRRDAIAAGIRSFSVKEK